MHNDCINTYLNIFFLSFYARTRFCVLKEYWFSDDFSYKNSFSVSIELAHPRFSGAKDDAYYTFKKDVKQMNIFT